MGRRRSFRGFVSRLYRAPVGLYRLRLGWLLGHRFLLLTHTGRKTGLPRQTVLEVMRHDSTTDTYVVAAGFGKRSNWYRNILASTNVTIEVGTQRRRARARRLDPEEAFQEFSGYVLRHPIAARVVVRFLGFGKDATADQLAADIPVVAFSVLDCDRQ